MDRREFALTTTGALALAASGQDTGAELKADVVVVGGGLGGCAAALGAIREGATVLLTEETDWLGGQLTNQCVPPDEHKFIETHGCTQLYRRLRSDLRERVRQQPTLTATARSQKNLNPGNGWVTRVGGRPRDWLEVLERLLAPAVASGKLRILREWTPTSATVNGDTVRAVLGMTKEGKNQTLIGAVFVDATEQGDLLPMTGTEFVTGSESHADTGEPLAKGEARPGNIQAFTWVMAMEHLPGENFTIDRPTEYDFWRDYRPRGGAQRLLSWRAYGVQADGSTGHGFDPTKDTATWAGVARVANLWTYRRVVDAKQHNPGSGVRDLSLINWGQSDYHLGPIHAVGPVEAATNLLRARQQALSLLYWLQTDAPRADGKVGWPGLRLVPSATGTADGIAKRPYIRESRRIRPEFRVVQQMVSGRPRAEPFPDTVGVGLYLYIDIHATAGGDTGGGAPVAPFQIPLGALLPQRVTNLVAGCKNLGVTHITNGCYRLHTVEWNIGESAGAVAGFAAKRGISPKQVRADAKLLADFQKRLRDGGVELEWPANAVN